VVHVRDPGGAALDPTPREGLWALRLTKDLRGHAVLDCNVGIDVKRTGPGEHETREGASFIIPSEGERYVECFGVSWRRGEVSEPVRRLTLQFFHNESDDPLTIASGHLGRVGFSRRREHDFGIAG